MIQFTRRALVIGGFEVYWYGLIIALGALAGCLLAVTREKRYGLKKDTSVDLVLLGAPIAILCARIYYVVFSWDYYSVHPAEIFDIRDGGIAIYGAVLGAMLAGWIYSRWKKIPFRILADLAAPSLALGQCIGRWGNFINEEAYGRAVANPALQFFPFAVQIEGSGWHYAAFFYESLWCALIVLMLLRGEKKGAFRKKGDVFLSYVFLYALERTVVEGLRTDSLYLGPLRVSQLLSLCAAAAVCIVLFRRAGHASRPARALPLAAVLLTAIAAALQSTLLTATSALLALCFAAAIYLRSISPDLG